MSKKDDTKEPKGQSTAEKDLVNIASTSANPFDLSLLKLSQDFESSGGAVRKLHTTIPVKKPSKQVFFRAFPAPDYQVVVAAVELKEEQDGGVYLVAPSLRDQLLDEIQILRLVTCIDRADNLFFWPLKCPKNGERTNHWHESAERALSYAEKSWVRVKANMIAGHYDVVQPVANFPDPETPELTLQQLIEIAFRGRMIDSAEHPVLKKLRGQE